MRHAASPWQPENRLPNYPPSVLSHCQDASHGFRAKCANRKSSLLKDRLENLLFSTPLPTDALDYVSKERFPHLRVITYTFFPPPSYPSLSLLNQFIFRLINLPPPPPRCLQSTRRRWKFHPGNSKSCSFMPRNSRKTSLSSDRKDKGRRYPSSLAFLGGG